MFYNIILYSITFIIILSGMYLYYIPEPTKNNDLQLDDAYDKQTINILQEMEDIYCKHKLWPQSNTYNSYPFSTYKLITIEEYYENLESNSKKLCIMIYEWFKPLEDTINIINIDSSDQRSLHFGIHVLNVLKSQIVLQRDNSNVIDTVGVFNLLIGYIYYLTNHILFDVSTKDVTYLEHLNVITDIMFHYGYIMNRTEMENDIEKFRRIVSDVLFFLSIHKPRIMLMPAYLSLYPYLIWAEKSISEYDVIRHEYFNDAFTSGWPKYDQFESKYLYNHLDIFDYYNKINITLYHTAAMKYLLSLSSEDTTTYYPKVNTLIDEYNVQNMRSAILDISLHNPVSNNKLLWKKLLDVAYDEVCNIYFEKTNTVRTNNFNYYNKTH